MLECTDDEKSWKIYDSILGIEIDIKLVTLLERMLAKFEMAHNSLEEIMDNVYSDEIEDEYLKEEIDNCFRLLVSLMSAELGYVRYDYDSKHQNGELHPLNHVDINYSSKVTYKLGLKNKVKPEEFIDMLDLKTKCRYLV